MLRRRVTLGTSPFLVNSNSPEVVVSDNIIFFAIDRRLINHSCDPNVVMVFPHSSDLVALRPNMQLVAIKAIKADEQVSLDVFSFAVFD